MSTRYDKRKQAGQTCHTLWLTKDATDALDALAAQTEASKTEVLERILRREFTMMKLLTGVSQELPKLEPVPPRVHIEKGRAVARPVPEPGSAAELAVRIREKGERRSAKIVATGRTVINGREQR